MICTYKFYTEDNKRIAAFAHPQDGRLMIFLLKCSPKDNFSKRVAREFYESWCSNTVSEEDAERFHPEIIFIDLDGDSRTVFLNFMEATFYRKGVSMKRYSQPILYRSGKTDNKKLYVRRDTVIYVGKARHEPTKWE